MPSFLKRDLHIISTEYSSVDHFYFIFLPTKYQHEKQSESFVFSLCLDLFAYPDVLFTVIQAWDESSSKRQKSTKEDATFYHLLFCKLLKPVWRSHGRPHEICWDKPAEGATKQVKSFPEQVISTGLFWDLNKKEKSNSILFPHFCSFFTSTVW